MNSRLIGLIKAFFIFIFVFYTIVSIENINNEIRKLKEEKKEIDDTLIDLSNEIGNLILKENRMNSIFLHSSGYQEIAEGLYAIIDSVDPHLTGLKIKGEILNTLAVDREGVSFKVHVGDKSGDFFIDEIPSGVAKKFEVYIPDADKDAKYAIFEYKSGVVKYYERK